MYLSKNLLFTAKTSLIIATVLYFAFVAAYSVNQYDLGFILSAVQRVKLGEAIYHDFDYVRPFCGIILWKYLLQFLSVESEYLILISRILVVLETFLISHLIQKIIFEKSLFTTSLFLQVCFLHTFPIMPWHTIDGVLFSLLAIFFYKKNWFLSSILFVVFTSLTKQSFFIFGFVFSIIIALKFRKNSVIQKNDFYLSVIITILFAVALYQFKIFENFSQFFSQVFNSSSGFYEAAIKSYFFDKTFNNILFVTFLLSLYFLKIKQNYLDGFLVCLFIAIVIFPFTNDGNHLFIHQVFLLTLVLFLKSAQQNKYIYFLFFVAWSSSISWGYNLPIFFTFILIYLYISKKSNSLLLLWFLALSSFFIYRIKYTYLSDSILSSNYIKVKDTPAISGLLISEKENSYILEAQKLNRDYKNIIFVPGSPLIDIINTSFPNRASWEMDVEYPNWKKDVKDLTQNIIAVDKAQSFRNGFFKSSFTAQLIEGKKIIKQTKYFTIYGN
ncbi:hypothetical protein [Chryseobacterium sp.]|uniref:hypothetical protein n=1 Tax=Chryseobacterium sp. TaxID=1871047 RepID=UPI00289A50AF|nr:hypothetical protein [Chryseobacterium sp.]